MASRLGFGARVWLVREPVPRRNACGARTTAGTHARLVGSACASREPEASMSDEDRTAESEGPRPTNGTAMTSVLDVV
jgi:hypothetical protein